MASTKKPITVILIAYIRFFPSATGGCTSTSYYAVGRLLQTDRKSLASQSERVPDLLTHHHLKSDHRFDPLRTDALVDLAVEEHRSPRARQPGI